MRYFYACDLSISSQLFHVLHPRSQSRSVSHSFVLPLHTLVESTSQTSYYYLPHPPSPEHPSPLHTDGHSAPFLASSLARNVLVLNVIRLLRILIHLLIYLLIGVVMR